MKILVHTLRIVAWCCSSSESCQRGDEGSPYVFTTERRGPLTDSAVRKIVARAGEVAGIDFPVLVREEHRSLVSTRDSP